jgi:hypothetical protein
MTHDIIKTSAADTLPPFDPATVYVQFRRDSVAVKGVRLHFVEGGSGRADPAAWVAAELVRVALCYAPARPRRAARDRARPPRDGRFRPARLRLRDAHGGGRTQVMHASRRGPDKDLNRPGTGKIDRH